MGDLLLLSVPGGAAGRVAFAPPILRLSGAGIFQSHLRPVPRSLGRPLIPGSCLRSQMFIPLRNLFGSRRGRELSAGASAPAFEAPLAAVLSRPLGKP